MKQAFLTLATVLSLMGCTSTVKYDDAINSVIRKVPPCLGMYALTRGSFTSRGYKWLVTQDVSGIFINRGEIEVWLDGREVKIKGVDETLRNLMIEYISGQGFNFEKPCLTPQKIDLIKIPGLYNPDDKISNSR